MKPIRTVIVDDSASFREFLVTYLEEQPEIELIGQCGSGEECLESAVARKAALVIMDARMPGLDGPQTTRRLKSEHPEIRVIMCTVWEEEEARDYALESGADDYFVKGEPLGDLMDKVRRMFPS